MKSLLFIVSILLIIFAGVVALRSKMNPWKNPFAEVSLGENQPDRILVPDDSNPAVFDKLLFEGDFLTAMSLLGQKQTLPYVSRNTEKNGFVEAKNIKRDAVVISAPLGHQKDVSFVVFYSFELRNNGGHIPGRQRLAIRWTRTHTTWESDEKVTTALMLQ